MKLKQLLESFYKGMKIADYSDKMHYVEIFKNPSPKEMRDAGGEWNSIRFFANIPSKTLFVWTSDLTHEQMGEAEYGMPDMKWPSVSGVAVKKGGKWVVADEEDWEVQDDYGEYEKQKKKLKWLEKYMVIT